MLSTQVSFHSWEFFLFHLYFPVEHGQVRVSVRRKTYALTAAPEVLNVLLFIYFHAKD